MRCGFEWARAFVKDRQRQEEKEKMKYEAQLIDR
jgi:hypothetical protein